MSYVAPVKDMLFCMKELADLEAIARLPGLEEAGLDTAQAVLEECARFSGEAPDSMPTTAPVASNARPTSAEAITTAVKPEAPNM